MRATRLAAVLAALIFIVALMPLPALADVSANPQSGIYHNTSCRHYGCKACTKIFKTADDAKKAGYRACKKCGG